MPIYSPIWLRMVDDKDGEAMALGAVDSSSTMYSSSMRGRIRLESGALFLHNLGVQDQLG